MRKPAFCYAKISTFVFATYVVQSLSYLNPKFQASSHLLLGYSRVFVGPGCKPQDRFSRDEAQLLCFAHGN